MFPDREMQLKILEELKGHYPEEMNTSELQNRLGLEDDPDFNTNLFYLRDHELVDGHEMNEIGRNRELLFVQISVNGIDFLADDGGLKAILSKVAKKDGKKNSDTV